MMKKRRRQKTGGPGETMMKKRRRQKTGGNMIQWFRSCCLTICVVVCKY